MRLAPVLGRPGTWAGYLCARCGARIDYGREAVLADLDGPAFTSYYHEACGHEAQRAAAAAAAAEAAKGGK